MKVGRPTKWSVKNKRRGFTLLEVILAVGIAVVLVFAIYQATAMYYIQTEVGREIAQRAQLVRALSARMQTDLRSAFTDFKPQNSSQSEDETYTSTTVSSNTIPAGGVQGTVNSLSIVVQQFPKDLDYSLNAITPVSDPKTDVRMIRYYLTTQDEGLSGLVREAYDQVPDPEMGLDPQPARMDLLAEEVREMQFEYYDGSQWLQDWGTEYDSAPIAIRARLGFSPAGQKDQDSAQQSASLEYFTFTVSLPQNMASVATAAAAQADSGTSATGGGTP